MAIRGNLVRRLLVIWAVAVAVCATMAALRVNRVATVSAAGSPANLVLVDVQAPGGCPVGTAYNFCDQVVNTTGATEVFFVNNTSAVTNLAVAIKPIPGREANLATQCTTTGPCDFTITSNSCTGNLDANMQCEIGIAFSPTAVGLRLAALTVTDAEGDSLPIDIQGTGANLALSTAGDSCTTPDNAFTYCKEPVGGTSAPAAFKLAATGLATGLSISLQAISGLSSEFGASDFTISSTDCGASLPAGPPCTINVEFTPKTAGLRSVALTATDDAGDTTVLYLAGSTNSGLSFNIVEPGPNPAACARVNFFGFCNEPTSGSTGSVAFTLQNTSGTQITGLTISPAFVPVGTNPPPAPTNFTNTSTSCTGTLAAGASCTINLAFTPQAAGLQQGALTVTDDAGDVTALNLAGTGDDFSLAIASGNSPLVTVAQGDTATFKAQLNADSVFGLNGEKVTLACPTNMPAFTTCEFQPCPVTPTVGGATAFDILIHTSTKTSETPPIANPCNLTAPAARTRRADTPSGILYVTTEPPAIGGSGFPALAIILAALALLGLGFVSARVAAAPRMRRAFAATTLVVVGGGIVAACHKNSNAISTATPLGTTAMNVTAVVVDSSGNSLNASRGLQVQLDVIQQAPKKP